MYVRRGCSLKRSVSSPKSRFGLQSEEHEARVGACRVFRFFYRAKAKLMRDVKRMDPKTAKPGLIQVCTIKQCQARALGSELCGASFPLNPTVHSSCTEPFQTTTDPFQENSSFAGRRTPLHPARPGFLPDFWELGFSRGLS